MARSPRTDPSPIPSRDAASIPRLIDAARGGDRAALDELLSLHLGRLQKEARRQCGNNGPSGLRPSDLVQDTAERAVRSFPRFHGNSDPEVQGWLQTILTNVLIQHRRAASRKKRGALEQVQAGADYENLPGAQESPSQTLSGKQTWRQLWSAVFGLPEAQREAINRYLRGASLDEIATALGRGKPAVSCLIQRATETLRRQMTGDHAVAGDKRGRRLEKALFLEKMRALIAAAD